MKLWIWSDLHLESQRLILPVSAPEGTGAIVCAGDLCRAADLEETAKDILERYRIPLVFVPGNHEFYSGNASGDGAPIEACRAIMAEAAAASAGWPAPLIVLDDASTIIGGVRFVGGTLWTDFALDGEEGDIPWRFNDALRMTPDFGRIRMDGDRRMFPQDMLDMHRSTRRFIAGELAVPFSGPTVVVTHHMPHPACIPPVWRGASSGFLYASSEAAFGALLEGREAPSLWVCGHTHHAFDVKAGRTRILCNPHGYEAADDERLNGFRWDLVAEV